MYTGHVAIALGARGLRRDLPLWVLVLATQACDWVEVIVRSVPPGLPADVYSHGYPFVVIAAVAVAVAVWIWKHSVPDALTVLTVYLSHPLADYVAGFKPLWLDGEPVGLRITARPGMDFLVQGLLCLAGFVLYRRSLPAPRRHRISALLPLIVLLTLQGLSDLARATRAQRRWASRTIAAATSTYAGIRVWDERGDAVAIRRCGQSRFSAE